MRSATSLRHRLRLPLTATIAVAATCAVSLAVVGPANAAPCGNPSSGSSGSLGGLGSLGDQTPPTSPGAGPQGPLPSWRNSTSRVVSWVTGPKSPNDTLARFAVSGTDLGVAWDNGRGQTLMAFGDSFGYCNVAGQQWRNNLLTRTDDDDLSDGVTIAPGRPGDTSSGAVVTAEAPNFAVEMVRAIKQDFVEITTIPTAGISVGGKQYVNFMSVRKWGAAGVWDTNYAAIAVSEDNGQTWTPQPSTAMINAPVTVALPAAAPTLNVNNSRFQQSGYVKGHGDDPYIYQVGTPNGRFGRAYLARFRPEDILNLSAYEYWLGTRWTSDLSLLSDDSAIIKAAVTELSVSWSEYLGKYILIDGDNAIRLRTATTPEGPWSAPRTLVPAGAVVLYGAMMLPQSPALTSATDNRLYFNGSRWSDYNVMLVESKLQKGW
ncbi:DUF4185 domain-containing protein [Gordonia alkaliphila]|uniref:DUF4185 domain-containing protein n=1 Tax=Gordonia alkaliphila TaxID=1053547 RepID=A0ABP8YW13_9ACTN